MKLTLPLNKISKKDASIAGGKGASLGEMLQSGVPVPDGFVVLSGTFDRFLEETDLTQEIDAILHTVDHDVIHTVENASEQIQGIIKGAQMPQDIAYEILKQFNKLDAEYVAVRSSATAEDSSSAAWAGQLDSFLNTTKGYVLKRVQDCWASLFTPRAIFYRYEKKLHTTKISVAVVVQKMVNSEKSGIAFSVHPVTQDYNQLIIEAGFGLGEAIVSGSITPDSYVVEKEPRRIVDVNVAEQTKGLYRKMRMNADLTLINSQSSLRRAVRTDAENTTPQKKHSNILQNVGMFGEGENGEKTNNEWKELGEKGKSQVLSEKEILDLSEIVLRIENHYGFPCDIEWAFEKDKFYITQSRPITTLTKKEGKEDKTNSEQKEKNLADKFLRFLDKDKLIVFEGRFFGPLLLIDWFKYYIPEGGVKPIYPLLFHRDSKIDKIYISLTKYYECSFDIFNAYLIEKIDIKEINKNYTQIKRRIEKNHKEYYSKRSLSEKEELSLLKEVYHDLIELVKWTLFLDVFDEDITENALKHNNLRIDLGKLMKISHIVKFPSFELKNNESIIEALEDNKDLEELQFVYTNYTNIPTKQEVEKIIKETNLEKLKELVRIQKEDLKRSIHESEKLTKNLNKQEKRVLDFVDWSIFLRDDRKIAINKGDTLFFNLTKDLFKKWGVNQKLVKLTLIQEVLKGKKYLKENLTKIEKREKGFTVIYYGEDVFEESEDSTLEDSSMLDKKIIEQNNNNANKHALIGESASPGYAKGRVKIILSTEEFDKFKEGDILVAPMTRPEYIPLMKKAAAIITDEGGLTCHAAIVSRELKKPCVIGTRIATKKLKDGMLVQINAAHGSITILKSERKSKTKTPFNYFGQRHFNLFTLCFMPYAELSHEIYAIEKLHPYALLKKDSKESLVDIFVNKKIHIFVDKKVSERLKRDSSFLNALLQRVRKNYDVIKGDLSSHKIYGTKKEFLNFVEKAREVWTDYAIIFWLIDIIEQDKNSIFSKYLDDFMDFRKYADSFVPNFNIMAEKNIKNYFNPDLIDYVRLEDLVNEVDEAEIRKRISGYFVIDTELHLLDESDLLEVFDYSKPIALETQTEVRGTSASPGKVNGIVKIVRTVGEANNFPKGHILIASMTTPDFMPAILNCRAIVTDEGGIVSHAAIVSRELKKPCVIGTKIATQVLKDGMMVEVDADKGVVRILKNT